MDAKRIVFICVGNMCRSQMAEGLAKYMGADRVTVESAGTRHSGLVSREAAACMAELGIDISGQWSKGLEEVDLVGADVVVSMAPDPARQLVPRECRALLLDWDVGDPVGYPLEIFRIVRYDLAERVHSLLTEMGVEIVPLPEEDESVEDVPES